MITCTKVIINELGCSPTRSENVYFANNEKTSIAACVTTHSEQNLINFKLYDNWWVQAFTSMSECAIWNSRKPIKFTLLLKSPNQSTPNKANVIEIIKACIAACVKAINSLVVWCREKKKKPEDGKNVSCKALTKNSLLT